MTVRVTVIGRGDATLTVHEGDATVADLAQALGCAVSVIDGRPHRPRDALAATTLRAGSVVGGPAHPPAAAAAADLVAVAGPQAGRRWPLRSGPNVVGRSPGADVVIDDPDLAGRQLRIVVTPAGASVADLGPSRSTPPGGQLVRAGRAAYRIEPPADATSPRPTGAFHRPPRPAPPPRPEPVGIHALEAEPPARLPVTLATVAAPLVVALIAATVIGSWWIVAMALGGAVVALGLSVEQRLRDRRARRSAARRRSVELQRLETAVAAQADATRAARWALACCPAEAVRRALAASSRLWERRPPDADAYLAFVGVADVEHRAVVEGRADPDDDVSALLVRPLPDVPVVARLGPGDVVGLSGDVDGLARSVVLQLAVTHGPADLRLRLVPGWEWARWLPHVDGTGMPLLVLEAGAPGAAAAVRAVVAEGGAALVLAACPDRLPAACAEVIEVGDAGRAAVHRPRDGRRVDDVLVAAVDEEVAEAAARALAAWTDPEEAGRGLPGAVALSDLVPLDAVAARWARQGPPAAVIGMSGSGPVRIDLAADGPHALVAGTTGSGKSELLRTLVAGLALEVPPDRLSMVLIDYKGGSAFDRCAELPHVVGYVTDLDEHLGARALVCLRAELRRREEVLRAAGAATIDDLTPASVCADAAMARDAAHRTPLARLLVVVDEFAALRADLPDVVGGLVDLAQRGRSLGVHLVLATQRPAGAVSDDIRANTDLRIALRVQSAADSTDVSGSPDAAQIRRCHPGRAVLRRGSGDVLTVQTATTARPHPAAGRSRVEARWHDGEPPATVDPVGPDDLDLVVEAVAAAWSATGRALPPAPWPPPLPDEIELAAVLEEEDAARPPGEGLSRVVVGVVDRPAEQRQVPLCWLPGEGNLLVIGAAGSGTTTTLLAAAASAWSSCVGGLDVVGLERRAGSLRELVDVPSATVVGPAGPGRAEVIQRLAASLEQRTSTGEVGTPVLVLVDGWPVLPDDPDGWTVREALVRLWVDGRAAGIHLAVASERSAAVPAAVAAGTTQRWYLRPCDPSELVLAGMGSQGAAQTFVPGRLLVAGGGWEAQVGRPARVLQGITRGCGRDSLKVIENY